MESVLGYIVLGIVALLVLYKKFAGGETEPEPLPKTVPAPVKRWQLYAIQFAKQYDLPWQIVLAQIWQESWGDPDERGEAGEYGLMQVMPIAVEDLHLNGYHGFEGWREIASQNIKAGTAFLDLQRKRTGKIYSGLQSVRATALEAYNEGYSQAKKDLGPDEYAQEVMEKARVIGYE